MYGHANPTIRTTPEGEQVGPKMHAAVSAVKSRSGTALGAYGSKNELAIAVGPNGSQDYGYRIVDRCIRKGLLEVDPDDPEASPSGQGAVVITQKGLDYLAQYDA